MNRLLNSILKRSSHLPLADSCMRWIYDHTISEASVHMGPEEAERRVLRLSPPPTSPPCWEQPLPESVADPVDLSVIVPFYKTESFAQICIDSITSQCHSYQIQIILVDDGSPDGCPQILDHYQNDPRFCVIHQPNQGVAAARNNGIRAARGRYLMFVDSDDILCEGAIQTLMETALAHDADIVEGSHQIIDQDGSPRNKFIRHEFAVERAGHGMFGYPWGKVMKRELFRHFCFPTGCWYEDTVISALIYPGAGKTVTVPQVVSLYRMNRTGLSATGRTRPKAIDTFHVIDIILQTQISHGLPPNNRSMLWQLGPFLFLRIQHLHEKDIQAAFVLACELTEKYSLTSDLDGLSFYENELREAFIHRRYHRWKWASILI